MAEYIEREALMDAFRKYMVEKHDKEKCVAEENCKTCDKGCLWRKIVMNAPTCSDALKDDALSLINRQKAEIERLQRLGASATRRMLNARTEAIKEFAERVKESLTSWDTDPTDEEIEWTIDNLVKEMVGERE